jgi:MFS superfamily sulfate permease-like transporter
VSLVALAYQAARPRVYVVARKPGTDIFRPLSAEHPEDETFPGLLMVRPEGRIFFVNAQQMGEQVLALIEQYRPRVLALEFGAVFDVEYSALKMLIEAEERLRERGILLWLVALNPDTLAMVQRTSLNVTLGRERLIFNLQAAVERYQAQEQKREDRAAALGA